MQIDVKDWYFQKTYCTRYMTSHNVGIVFTHVGGDRRTDHNLKWNYSKTFVEEIEILPLENAFSVLRSLQPESRVNQKVQVAHERMLRYLKVT